MMKTAKKLDRPMRLTERVLLVGSLALLSWAALLLAESRATQAYGNWSLDRIRQGRTVSRLDFAADRFFPAPLQSWIESPGGAPGKAESDNPIRAGGLVGRIEIPRLHVRAIVLEGDGESTLARGVGHIPGTPFPGEPGNAALAAHRDSFFHPLIRIRRFDRITLVTPEKTYRYSVDSVRIVAPERIDVLAPTLAPTLTLVTCYPFDYVGPAPSRFVVRARQLDPL